MDIIKDTQHPENYFKNVKPGYWEIIDFLLDNANALKDAGGPSLLCDTWLRGLRKASKDDTRAECDRSTARRLLNKYEVNGGDQLRARRFFDLFSSTQTEAATHPSQPAIIIHGNSNKATINSTNPTQPIKPPLPSSRKRKRSASVPRYLKEFESTWSDLEDSKKWCLSTGTIVEDVLYEKFKDAQLELAVHSWVIDTSDESIKKCFSAEEWEMILEQVPPLSKPDEWFLNTALQYGKFDNAGQLYNYVYSTPPLTPDEMETLDDDDEKCGRIWLDNVMRCWCNLLCGSGTLFAHNHQEYWYITNIWGPVYDNCMNTVLGSYMSRGESKSLCTSDRKNSSGAPKKRQRVGHLYDGILTLLGHEVGAAEHSRKSTSKKDRKWAKDTLKVVKVLHDMLYKLQLPGAVRPSKPQVLGVVTAGWRCQNWRMTIGKGYMCVLDGDTVREIPSTFDRIGDLLELLTLFWLFRNVLKDCKESVNPAKSSGNAQLRDRLLNVSASITSVVGGPAIPKSVETDYTSGSEEEPEG